VSDSTDVISSDEPTERPGRMPRQGSLAGAGARTTAMTAALTLVVAAGVTTAAYRGATGGTSPTSLIPAGAFAVATADLSLPDGQAGALETLLGRFPELHLTGDGSIRDRVLRSIIQSGDDSIDYDKDVKPWLGDHVAVAGWQNNGHPQMEVVLQSSDDSSARSHLEHFLNDNGDVEFRDGYAVLGSSQDAVRSALAAADKSSLDDAGPYDGDIKALGHTEAITAWFDGPAAKDVLGPTMLGGPEGALAFSGLGALGGGMGTLFKGRVSLGVHVTDTVAEIDARSVGAQTTKSAPSKMLTSLPSGTVGALEFGDPGMVVDSVTPLIRGLATFAGGGVSGSCASSAPPTPARAPRSKMSRHQPPMSRCYSDTPAPPIDPFAQIQKAIGISFPDDVKTVLGDRAVVAFGGLELAGLPDVAIRSHPADLAAAQSLGSTLSTALSGSSPVNIDVSTAGEDLILATSSAYGQEIAKAGDLGDQSDVKSALDGIPGLVNVAAYVNLSRVWPLVGAGVPEGVKHLHAIGFWAANDGDVQTAQLRAVFG
jgi:hypothetical protein